jgi:hypothetical protein
MVGELPSRVACTTRGDDFTDSLDGRLRRSGSGGNQFGHKPAHLLWGIEFAGTLPLAFGKFQQQVFIGATPNIGLGISQTKSVAADDFDELSQVIIQRVLTALTFLKSLIFNTLCKSGFSRVIPRIASVTNSPKCSFAA